MATKKEIEEIKALLEELKKASAISPTIDIEGINDAAAAAAALNEAMSSITDENAKTSEQFVEISNNIGKILEHAKELDDIEQEKLKNAEKEHDTRKKISGVLEEDIKSRQKSLMLQKEMGELERIQSLSRAQALKELISEMSAYGDSVIDIALQFDSVSRSLSQATTSGNQYKSMLEDISVNTRIVGATSADVAAAITTLHQSFTGFTTLAEKQKADLAEFAVVMNKVGLATADFAKFLDSGTKAMGMSVGEVKTFSSELVSFAEQSGISMQQLGANLAAIGPKLSVFDKDNGQRIFKEMALASKNLGIEMSRLFDITERFTTFEGAASAAGQLNMALGGNFINSLDLMNASLEDPVETFRLLKSRMDASGKSFDEMTPAMKRFLAEAAGFSSVDEAARVFSQDVDAATESLKAQAKTQEELNKIAQSYTNIQTKLNSLYASFRPIITTVVEVFGDFLDILIKIVNNPIGQFIVLLVGSIGALIAIVGMAAKTLVSFLTPIFLIMQVIRGTEEASGPAGDKIRQVGQSAGRGLRSMAGGINAVGKALTKNAPGFLAFGATIVLIGTGIAIAAVGLAELVKSFNGLGLVAIPATVAIIGFTAAFGLLILGLLALVTGPQAVLTTAAIGVLLAVGAAALMIGGGMALAADGIAKVIESLVPLIDNLVPLTNLFSEMLLLGPALLGIAAGFGSLMAVVGVGSLFGISPISILEDLGKVVKDFPVSSFTQIAAAVEKLASSLEKINTDKLEKLKDFTSGGGTIFASALALAPALIATSVIVATAAPMLTANNAVPLSPTLNTANEATSAASDSTTRETAKPQKQEIVVNLKIDSPIQLSGREMGRWADARTFKVLDTSADASGRTNPAVDINLEQQQAIDATRTA
mgnify:CR=1 FL=1